jgi:hypothetical protein
MWRRFGVARKRGIDQSEAGFEFDVRVGNRFGVAVAGFAWTGRKHQQRAVVDRQDLVGKQEFPAARFNEEKPVVLNPTRAEVERLVEADLVASHKDDGVGTDRFC